MSGHSHFKTIKYRKEITDRKRGQMFSKIAWEISIAARQGGGDPQFNPKLRLAIGKARSVNMPADKIERAIEKGIGRLEGVKLEEVLFEALGPGKIAIIILGITDNKKRTLAEIKQILNQNNGKLVKEGEIKWMFERKGCIVIDCKLQITANYKNKEALELAVIEAGADDIYWHDNVLDVYTKIEDLEAVKGSLEQKGIKIDSATLDWVAKKQIELTAEQTKACQKLFEALDENEAVQEIYSNLKV